MKRCLVCSAAFPSLLIGCPSCGYSPPVIDGYLSFAPELAKNGGGFKAECFEDLARLEGLNFWFRTRNKLISWALGRYAPNFESFLEVGCGTGFVLNGVADTYPDVALMGSEIFTSGLVLASTRLPLVDFIQMDGRQIPFIDEFDSIGVFDVLEHIVEDINVLEQIYMALKSGGILLLTVPQHPFLWSSVDEYAFHVRRYSSREILNKVASAGFELLRTTSFVSSLMPAMMVSRILIKKNDSNNDGSAAELDLSPILNSLFTLCLNVEFAAIRCGINFPFGGSRLVVARKK